LADKLLEFEVIFKEDLEEIFGKRQWEKEEEVEIKTDDVVLEAAKEVVNDAEISTEQEVVSVESSSEETEIPTAE
jgi:cell division protease FtsH